jgi:hypothetical protein
MIRLSLSTRIALEEPSTEGGFITWFDVLIHRDAPVVDDGGAGGEDLEEGDEKVEQIGRVRLAIVHVGALFESDDSLYDVLDADSGDLEALYHLYFDEEEEMGFELAALNKQGGELEKQEQELRDQLEKR